jgi:5-carboxymethyl-2-hydroxymuconate isomerase
MPFCTIDYTSNITNTPIAEDYFLRLHNVLEKCGSLNPQNIKTKAVMHDDFRVAKGAEKNAFVQTTLRILTGRSMAVKKDIAKRLHEFQIKEWKLHTTGFKVSISVEIQEINTELYIK